MAILIVMAVVFGSLGVHVYRLPQIEEKTIEFVALQDNIDLNGNPRMFLVFEASDGKILSFDKRDIIVADEVWNNLRKGDMVVLEHYIEYWEIFGKKITKKHIDNLRLKVGGN